MERYWFCTITCVRNVLYAILNIIYYCGKRSGNPPFFWEYHDFASQLRIFLFRQIAHTLLSISIHSDYTQEKFAHFVFQVWFNLIAKKKNLWQKTLFRHSSTLYLRALPNFKTRKQYLKLAVNFFNWLKFLIQLLFILGFIIDSFGSFTLYKFRIRWNEKIIIQNVQYSKQVHLYLQIYLWKNIIRINTITDNILCTTFQKESKIKR